MRLMMSFSACCYNPQIGPFLQWGAGGCHTPRQMFWRQITKFAMSMGKSFYFFAFLELKKKN